MQRREINDARARVSARIANYVANCENFLYDIRDYFRLSDVVLPCVLEFNITWQKRNNKVHDKLSWTLSNYFYDCNLIAIRFPINCEKRASIAFQNGNERLLFLRRAAICMKITCKKYLSDTHASFLVERRFYYTAIDYIVICCKHIFSLL